MKSSLYILITLLFSISACSETVETEYATLDIARKENAIRTGLIPEWVPNSSQQIKVVFDIHTNEKILGLQYKNTEAWNPLDTCQQINPADPPKPHLSRSWWPENVPANNGTMPRHTFYTCENGDSFLAVHPKIGQVFFWNTKYQ